MLQWSHGILAMERAQANSQARIPAALQWSHGILAMESTVPASTPSLISPLQWSHGILAMESAHAQAPGNRTGNASMEPWHFSHGEMGGPCATLAGKPLQWSHGILAMESQGDDAPAPQTARFNGAMAF